MSGPKKIICDGIFIYCDDDGGGALWELPRAEAITLFRRWLNESKHMDHVRAAYKGRELAATKGRVSLRVISGGNHE